MKLAELTSGHANLELSGEFIQAEVADLLESNPELRGRFEPNASAGHDLRGGARRTIAPGELIRKV